MVDKLNTAEGGTNNTAVTTGNSGGASGDAASAITGDIKFQTGAALLGSMGFRATLTSGTESSFAWTVSGTTHYFRLYFRTDSGSTTHNKRMVINGVPASATTGWDVRQIVSSERIGFATRNVTRFELGPTGVGTGTLARNTIYRVEGKIDSAAGTIDGRLYDAAGTLLSSSSYSGTVDAVTSLKFGTANGTAISTTTDFDAIGYSPTTWLGAYIPPIPPVAIVVKTNIVKIDATGSTAGNGGARSYSIAQTSGTTQAPSVVSAGVWTVVPSETEDLVYDVTVTEGALTDVEPVTVSRVGSGSGPTRGARRFDGADWV